VVLLLLASSVAIFAAIDNWLFPFVESQLYTISDLGYLRTICISSGFLLRERWLSAHFNDSISALRLQQEISNMSAELRRLHLGDYTRDLAAGGVSAVSTRSAYLSHIVAVAVPDDRGWRDVNMSFWEVGLDFARRLDEAANVSLPDLRADTMMQGSSSGSDEGRSRKRSMAYIFENSLRGTIPAFDFNVKQVCVMSLLYESCLLSVSHVSSLCVLSPICESCLLSMSHVSYL
jgi:hypothetical protein